MKVSSADSAAGRKMAVREITAENAPNAVTNLGARDWERKTGYVAYDLVL